MNTRMRFPSTCVALLTVCMFVIAFPVCSAGDGTHSGKKEQDAQGPHRKGKAGWLTVKEPRFLHVLLKLRKDTVASDTRVVEALRKLRWFTHIILVIPSWQERPNATEHPLVQQALRICRERKIPVVWGRWLWVAWRSKQDKRPLTLDSEFDAAFYEAAILNVKREAKAIGAVATFLDAEPYGKCPQFSSLKRKKLIDKDRRRIRRAIEDAVSKAGPVDLIYPSSSSPSWHYAWSMADLGILRCDSKTYYTRAKRYELPKIRPPHGFTHRVDLWGSAVGLGRPEDVYHGNVTLTSPEVVALDLPRIRERFPNCRGFWVWVSHDILPEVIRSWPD